MPSVLHTEFAARLRQSRTSQVAFARLCDVTPMAVNHWCRGRRDVPAWAWALVNALAAVAPAKLLAPPQMSWHIVLDVPEDCTAKAAAAARAKLAKRYHPDAGGDSAAMARINAAYDTAKKFRP
jgi:DNA-binding transcriptional regulator YdaS (Cro superfamily)